MCICIHFICMLIVLSLCCVFIRCSSCYIDDLIDVFHFLIICSKCTKLFNGCSVVKKNFVKAGEMGVTKVLIRCV